MKGLNGIMTEEINVDWKALYEQLCAENEVLQEKLLKVKLSKWNIDTIVNTAKSLMRNAYFWIGYFVAILVMYVIDRIFSKGV